MNLSWTLTATTLSLHYSTINNITYAAKHFIKNMANRLDKK